MYFLYKLIDPITKEIKYIVYTKRPKTRLWEHIRDAKVGIKTYKCDWIRSLILKNQKPIIEIISNYESQDKAANEEIRLIKGLRESGYKLTNLTEGGDGQRGTKLKKNHPLIYWNKGKKMSDYSKKKLSDSKKGINFTEEHKEKLSRAKKGKKRSKESIENQIKTKSEPIKVITPTGEEIFFDKTNEAVKFTGVSSKQIKKLIELNKKSRKGFLFQKLIHEPFI